MRKSPYRWDTVLLPVVKTRSQPRLMSGTRVKVENKYRLTITLVSVSDAPDNGATISGVASTQ